MQRIKFSRSQTSKRSGEAKQKTLQTSKKWLAAVLLAPPAGFEPVACRLGGDRSILLSYGTIWLKPFIFKAVSVSDDDIFITISANIGVIFVLASC